VSTGLEKAGNLELVGEIGKEMENVFLSVMC